MDDRTLISDAELELRCLLAIKDKMARDALLLKLRGEKRKISNERLNPMWEKCGGLLHNRG